MTSLHPIQATILYTLRRTTEARFRDLLHMTNLESDTFKFHLRKMVDMKLVQHSEKSYTLTSTGKEFANNLDSSRRTLQKQPKLSVAIIIETIIDNELRYLVQQRKRNPYFGFWGFLSGPIRWGETPEEAALRECRKQTGCEPSLSVVGFYRQRDFMVGGSLLEDKLFTVVRAKLSTTESMHVWSGGINQWMTLAELQRQPKVFKSSIDLLNVADGGYKLGDTYYEEAEY